jgi:hypothetical protein
LVPEARSAAPGGDDRAKVLVGEAQVFADEGAGDESLPGFAAKPGFADGEPLGRGCGRVEKSTRFFGGGVGGLGVPRWLGCSDAGPAMKIVGLHGGLEVRDGLWSLLTPLSRVGGDRTAVIRGELHRGFWAKGRHLRPTPRRRCVKEPLTIHLSGGRYWGSSRDPISPPSGRCPSFAPATDR